MKKAKVFLALLSISGIALTACVPGGNSGSKNENETVITDPDKIPKSEVTILDTFTGEDDPLSKWLNSVIKKFESEHDQIDIKRVSENYSDVQANLRLRLGDKNSPDIVPANQGWQGIGSYAKSDLIVNLDKYADAYGWNDKIPSTILKQHQYSKKEDKIGTGSLYGVPVNQGAIITVYYNKAHMEKISGKIPKTLADFEALMQKAKEAKIVPLQIGLQDQQGTAPLLALSSALGDKQNILDFVYSTAEVSAAETGIEEAAASYLEWAKKGYLPENFEGINSGDSLQSFVDGDGLFQIYYSGFLPFRDQQHADEFGNFILPREDGGDTAATASATQNFSISQKSKVKNAAALFLEYISNESAGEIALENNLIPIFGSWDTNQKSSNVNDGIKSINEISESDGYLPYYDWATPTMLDTLNQQLQLLLANKISPEEFTKAVQEDYESSK